MSVFRYYSAKCLKNGMNNQFEYAGQSGTGKSMDAAKIPN